MYFYAFEYQFPNCVGLQTAADLRQTWTEATLEAGYHNYQFTVNVTPYNSAGSFVGTILNVAEGFDGFSSNAKFAEETAWAVPPKAVFQGQTYNTNGGTGQQATEPA